MSEAAEKEIHGSDPGAGGLGGIPHPDEVELAGLKTPALGALDILGMLTLAVLWSLIGFLRMSPLERGMPIMWPEPIGGGIGLAVGTAGLLYWLRRRSIPALASESQAWALLGLGMLAAFAMGLVSATAGHLVLIVGGLGAMAISFNHGWQLTTVTAMGRFGGLAAVVFAVWSGIDRCGWWVSLLGLVGLE